MEGITFGICRKQMVNTNFLLLNRLYMKCISEVSTERSHKANVFC